MFQQISSQLFIETLVNTRTTVSFDLYMLQKTGVSLAVPSIHFRFSFFFFPSDKRATVLPEKCHNIL